jgi:hypothetical protein
MTITGRLPCLTRAAAKMRSRSGVRRMPQPVSGSKENKTTTADKNVAHKRWRKGYFLAFPFDLQ